MNKKRWIAAAVVVGIVAVGSIVFIGWYFFFRDDAPPRVSADRAAETLDSRSTNTTTAGGAGSAARGLDGTWTVDDSIGSFTDFTGSFAGFRVQEELVGVGAKTAVGRTPDVTGGLTIDGTTIPKASFAVDMTTLTTDDARRDGAIRGQAIETSRFPTATFVLTKPIELGSIPAEGAMITVNATGNLTLHGVTKEVTIPLQTQRKGDAIAVVGTLEIPFADYAINKPSAAAVLSVEDRGEMEIQLFLTRTT